MIVQHENIASVLDETRAWPGLVETYVEHGHPVMCVDPARILSFISALKDRLGFVYFIDVTGVDYSKYSLPRAGRFAVIYTLLSPERGVRAIVCSYLPGEDPSIESIAGVYPGADWAEREVYDMYGIRFTHHPDLKRILMPDDFDGHPLRKDYPLKGRGERASFPVYEAQHGHGS